MASTYGQQRNISGAQFDLMPAFAAQQYARVAFRKTENFVCRGMVVVIIIDPVPPLRRPAVSCK